MKKLLFTLALAAVSLGAATAQTTPATPAAPGYAESLGTTITAIMNTGNPAELRELAGTCERAASVAPQDWLPRYYQAYALLINVFQSKEAGDTKDKTLDQAEAALTQARALRGDESELLTLQAYIYQARLGLDPPGRSRQYARLVMAAVAQAKAQNPANPRPYLVGANNVYFTPAAFGGGPAVARPLYEEAKAKYSTFQPAGPLAPSWGQSQVLGRLKRYDAPAPTAAN